ncbi:tetratricopeptide repeat-containing protein [Fusarium circinatum]|uniref:Tetratricopeptide repeat-containing protein n=1 Tax=Fusarium circinatum TaxID=48490 RepID=A0A8H5WED4_FUSCI|nr:tetratricopeptide repeat-containing protein [Fusarium circinatum]
MLLPERESRLTTFSILGIGGVGKSQLALQFTYRHLNHFNAVFWIPAETSVKIKGAFEEIGTEVGLQEPNGSQGNLEAVAQKTKKWLRNYDKPFLLIFDNAESMSMLQNYLPTGGGGSIIITTRNQNFFQPPVTAWTHLQCFSKEEGKRYLLTNIPQGALAGNETDSEHAEKIYDACGGLPLALSQVHRFICALTISLDEANRRVAGLEAFVNASSELNGLPQTDYYHPTGVPSLWNASLNALNPSCSAIVKSIAFLDPDDMPERFLRLFSESNNQAGQQARAITSSEFNSQILTLLETSLIYRASKSNTFSTHSLLQQTVLQDLDRDQHMCIFRSVLDIIDDTFPYYDDSDRLVTSWPQCKQVLPHVLRLSVLCSSVGSYEPAVLLKLGDLLERAAWYLQERGAREEAAKLLERALNIAKAGLQLFNDSSEGSDPAGDPGSGTVASDLGELVSAITNSLGTLELGRGNFSKAQKFFEDAITRRESMGVIDRETIYMKRNVGVALLSSNSVQPALEIFKESLALVEEKLVTSDNPRQFHEDLAFCYGSIAFALIEMGQLEEAWDVAVKSTELLKQSYTLKSPRIGDCYTTLGNIRLLQGNLQEAETFLLQALDIRVEACGEHEETALAMHNYARILKELGRSQDAL